jgi:serine 3-dehydrogenase
MTVLISGASSGIGEACARTFGGAGHDLILVARREERLIRLSQELTSQYPIQVHLFPLDVRDLEKIKSLFESNTPLFQKVDILINNAGLARGLGPIQEGLPEDWDVMIDTNIKGMLYLLHSFLPGMIERKRGHIINIGSIAGHWVYEKGAVYCASKFAVKAINEGLRLDLHGTGIRVTAISPGMVETEFSEVRFGDKERAKALYANRKPLTAADIAETALWCAQRPPHVNIQEIILFPTDQASAHSGLLMRTALTLQSAKVPTQ